MKVYFDRYGALKIEHEYLTEIMWQDNECWDVRDLIIYTYCNDQILPIDVEIIKGVFPDG